jgi:hypothetical protein
MEKISRRVERPAVEDVLARADRYVRHARRTLARSRELDRDVLPELRRRGLLR